MQLHKHVDLSLVITTYRSADKLRRVLDSVNWQSVTPAQVIVADDGSDSNTGALLSEYSDCLVCPVIHSWQPDSGFRLARSRNLAGLRVTGSWIVFLDGDCVMPPDFIKTQAELAENRCVVFGSRKLLSERETKQLLAQAVSDSGLSTFFSGRKFWKLKLGILRTFPRRSWKQLRGFHIGISRECFTKLGGFDETFESWGLEDSEFAVRAQRSGRQLKDGRYATSVLHLWHPESSIRQSSNREAFDELLTSGRILPLKTTIRPDLFS